MNRPKSLCLLALLFPAALLLTTPGCRSMAPAPTAQAQSPQVLGLIPLPASVQPRSGEFRVDAGINVYVAGTPAHEVAQRFVEMLARGGKVNPRIIETAQVPRTGIAFVIDPALQMDSDQAYALDVTPRRIVVSARHPRGLFYGAVTLWQLLTRGPGRALGVPALRIDDTPRFAWRGVMLDSARHFQTVAQIKRVLDAMALHKLNTFHWHLTDDQGWRIEIKRYPRLTEVGGCRIPAGDAGIDPTSGAPKPYCGFYTQDQIREVVRYAAQRYITVVPEIDVPGHAQAAIAAYPALGVLGTTPAVSNQWGVHSTLFNTEESTFAFLENVFAEVVDLFPGRYVHVGGDEAVKDQWQASPRVQARMREVGVADEMAMQGHLIRRLEKFLAQHGRRLIGWDEILEGDLPAEATVMSWRGIEGGVAAAAQGHDVVMSPASDLYLDYLQTDSPNEPPGRPAMVTLQQVYAFEPVPATLPADQRRHILGVQANVWTEHMRSFERVEHALFPRIAALAETAWSPVQRRDWNGFVARLPVQLRRYRSVGIGYAQTPFEVRSVVEAGDEDGKAEITLSNPLDYPDIRYTTDGSTPQASSIAYTGPFEIALPVDLRASVFIDGRTLASPMMRKLDAASLRTRSDEELAMCTGALVLRLEDDGPLQGERALFNVDIFNPCWQWKQAKLSGVNTVQVRAGRLPYLFQLAHDETSRTFKPATSAYGELEIRDGCDGPLLARVPLPKDPDADGFVTLDAGLTEAPQRADLCLLFTGDTRPTLWVLDRVTLLPR